MFTAIYKTVQSALSTDAHDENESTDGSPSDSDIPIYPASQSSYDESSEFEADVEVKNIDSKVTKVLSGYGLINDDVYFSFDSVISQFRPRVGDSVNAVAYRDRKESGWRAKRVIVNTKDWDDEDDDDNAQEDMIGVITKATRIETVINDVIQCSHDSIVHGYRPYRGDWIQACKYKDPETGSTLVKDVRPLREQDIHGTITHVYVGYGFINDRIYFAFSACECGYTPQKGDRVVARCIESKQKRGNWRAVGVELKKEKQLPRPEDLVVGPLQSMKEDLMKDKCGVMITDKLDFSLVTCGKAKTINFWIRNVGIGIQVLKRFSVCNLHSEIAIEFPDKTESKEEQPENVNPQLVSLLILPGLALQGTITVKTQNLGKLRELVTFDFGSFQIGRYIYMEVQDEKMKVVGCQGDSTQKRGNSLNKYKEQYFHSQSGIRVYGVRPTRTYNWNTPVKLDRHPVPEEMVQCVLEKKDVTALIPELLQSLSIENYFTRFSALLHLEEIQMEIEIRKYDLERESLRHRGEYLALGIKGLAEGRPSVLVGDKIILTPIGAAQNTVSYEGYVHEVHGEEVLLKFHPKFHEDYVAEEYHVTFTFSKTVLQRCHQAANMAVDIGKRILFPTTKTIEVKPPVISITFPESQQPIKATFRQPVVVHRVAAPPRPRRHITPNQTYTTRKTPASDCQFIIPKFATSSPPRSSSQANNKVVGQYFDKKLNTRQKIAVLRILQAQTRPSPYILFGPPGTGKTVTVVEAILQVHHHLRSSRILACTPSNSAADLLTSRLANSGRVKQNDLIRLNSFRRSDENIEESIKPYCTNGQNLEIVAHYRIIVCTCSTAGSFFQLKLLTGHFTHIFVDEAGQAMEPECLIPVALATGDDSQIILAGDPMQLGPVLQSKEAIKLSLNQSLLERLMQRPVYQRDEKKFRDHGSYDPLLVTKLVDNYRSHECILHIPSNLFYHDELVVKANVNIRERFQSWELLPSKENFPIIFHGIQGEELQEGNSPSWFNAAEAVQTLKYVQALLQQTDKQTSKTVNSSDCGIITPYRKQVEKIRLLLTSVGIEGIKVGSVEEFQGQEKPVIIISTVRSGENLIGFDLRHKLGFLSNPKRFNVSVTRAQALLIVVGNPFVLAKDPKWLAMLTYCVKHNAYVGCELPDLEGQDEMELIKLEKLFYEDELQNEDVTEELETCNEPRLISEVEKSSESFELLQMNVQATKTDQCLSDFLKEVGILSNSIEEKAGVKDNNETIQLSCCNDSNVTVKKSENVLVEQDMNITSNNVKSSQLDGVAEVHQTKLESLSSDKTHLVDGTSTEVKASVDLTRYTDNCQNNGSENSQNIGPNDQGNTTSLIVKADCGTSDELLIQVDGEITDSKTATLETDGLKDINAKHMEIVSEISEIISNVQQTNPKKVTFTDTHSGLFKELDPVKDLMTFSDSDDSSIVNKFVTDVIQKQVINLQKEAFAEDNRVASASDCITGLMSVDDSMDADYLINVGCCDSMTDDKSLSVDISRQSHKYIGAIYDGKATANNITEPTIGDGKGCSSGDSYGDVPQDYSVIPPDIINNERWNQSDFKVIGKLETCETNLGGNTSIDCGLDEVIDSSQQLFDITNDCYQNMNNEICEATGSVVKSFLETSFVGGNDSTSRVSDSSYFENSTSCPGSQVTLVIDNQVKGSDPFQDLLLDTKTRDFKQAYSNLSDFECFGEIDDCKEDGMDDLPDLEYLCSDDRLETCDVAESDEPPPLIDIENGPPPLLDMCDF